MNLTLRKLMLLDLVIAIPFFVLSGVFKTRDPQIIGSIGWFGFMLTVLFMIVLVLVATVQWLRRRGDVSTPAGG